MKLRGLLSRRPRKSAWRCEVCFDHGTLLAGAWLARGPVCTCGAGDSILVLHDRDCDTIPCPFCPR